MEIGATAARGIPAIWQLDRVPQGIKALLAQAQRVGFLADFYQQAGGPEFVEFRSFHFQPDKASIVEGLLARIMGSNLHIRAQRLVRVARHAHQNGGRGLLGRRRG